MNTTTPENLAPRARYRQWETVTLDRLDGAVIQTRRQTVALFRSRFTGELHGLVNGNAVPLRAAVSILQGADRVTKVYEVLEQPEQAPTIGNAEARELHRELGRLRFRDHYATASEALGTPVHSLAALTAEQACTVRSYARGQWGMSA